MKFFPVFLFALSIFVSSSLFGAVVFDISPSADFFGDRVGYQIKGDVVFPFGNFFFGPGFIATGVSTNDFYFHSYSLGVLAGTEWRPFVKIPVYLSPGILVGAGYALRGDRLGFIDGLFGLMVLCEADLDYALSESWRAGLSFGMKWFATQSYGLMNLQCGIHLSFRPVNNKEKSRSLKR